MPECFKGLPLVFDVQSDGYLKGQQGRLSVRYRRLIPIIQISHLLRFLKEHVGLGGVKGIGQYHGVVRGDILADQVEHEVEVDEGLALGSGQTVVELEEVLAVAVVVDAQGIAVAALKPPQVAAPLQRDARISQLAADLIKAIGSEASLKDVPLTAMHPAHLIARQPGESKGRTVVGMKEQTDAHQIADARRLLLLNDFLFSHTEMIKKEKTPLFEIVLKGKARKERTLLLLSLSSLFTLTPFDELKFTFTALLSSYSELDHFPPVAVCFAVTRHLRVSPLCPGNFRPYGRILELSRGAYLPTVLFN